MSNIPCLQFAAVNHGITSGECKTPGHARFGTALPMSILIHHTVSVLRLKCANGSMPFASLASRCSCTSHENHRLSQHVHLLIYGLEVYQDNMLFVQSNESYLHSFYGH